MLASVVNFFNPSLVVIGGGVAQSGDQLLAAVREAIHRRSLPLATRDLVIQRSSLGSQAGIIGASAMVVDQLFARETSRAGWPPATRPRSAPARPRSPARRGALRSPGTTTIGEVARRRVLEDQLLAAVGQDLALDDDLAVVALGLRSAAMRARHAAAPLEQLDRLPRAALRRAVAGVHDRVDHVAVVERLLRRRARRRSPGTCP